MLCFCDEGADDSGHSDPGDRQQLFRKTSVSDGLCVSVEAETYTSL